MKERENPASYSSIALGLIGPLLVDGRIGPPALVEVRVSRPDTWVISHQQLFVMQMVILNIAVEVDNLFSFYVLSYDWNLTVWL